jgi:CRP-like cAMP-binding protein
MIVTDEKFALLVEYFKAGTRTVYKKGELVIRPQESPEHIYFIESGFVKAYSITKYGDENLHLIRHKDEIFPLIWTFTEVHRDVAYEVLETAVIWKQPKDDYLDYLSTNPDATTAVLGIAMRTYRTFAEHVNTLEYRTVRERAVSFLLACCRRFGEVNTDGSVRIIAPLKQQDIASSINASRETTSRELSVLTRKGLIVINDRSILVIDPKKLQAML